MPYNPARRTRNFDTTDHDFYVTPDEAIYALLNKQYFDKKRDVILEPCSGNGAISKIFEIQGLNVISSDIRQDKSIYGNGDTDFLKFPDKKICDFVVTNPPFKLAETIVLKSLNVSRKGVCLFLRLAFLESERRLSLFQNTPLKTVFVFSKRICMFPENYQGHKTSGTLAFAWFVWEHGYNGKPQIDWISKSDFSRDLYFNYKEKP